MYYYLFRIGLNCLLGCLFCVNDFGFLIVVWFCVGVFYFVWHVFARWRSCLLFNCLSVCVCFRGLWLMWVCSPQGLCLSCLLILLSGRVFSSCLLVLIFWLLLVVSFHLVCLRVWVGLVLLHVGC